MLRVLFSISLLILNFCPVSKSVGASPYCNKSTPVINNSQFEYLNLNINSCSQIYLDSSKQLGISHILTPEFQNRFIFFTTSSPPYNLSKVNVWRKFSVESKVNTTVYLDPGYAEYITVFLVRKEKVVKIYKGGLAVPRDELTSKKFFKYFKIDLLKNEPISVYIQLKNNFPSPSINSLALYDSESFWFSQAARQNSFRFFFYGAVLIMIFYNFFLYITAKDKAYLLYVLYMLSILIPSLLDYRNYHSIFPTWSNYPMHFFITSIIIAQTIGIFYILFASRFTDLAVNLPRFYAINKFYFKIRLISIPIVILFYFKFKINLSNAGHAIDIIYCIVNMGAVYFSRQKIGKYFVWGGTLLIIGASITVLELYNVNIFGVRTFSIPLQAGILGEFILFSVGLGIRVKHMELEKRVTERHLLNQLLENEKLQTQVNRELEEKVKERTSEIEKRNEEITKQNMLLVGQKEELQVQAIAIRRMNDAVHEKNEELRISLEKLKIAQGELVQSEKMASLGLLTAGIAHEINNPINFVSANVKPLKNDFKDIKELFLKYRSLHAAVDYKKELEVIEKCEKSIDATYLFQEIEMLLNGIEEGAVRTREIVLGLKHFSRSEETGFKPADLNAGLESTLMLLKGKIRNRITVVRDFQNDLPQVECFPGKINQVFMNILTNSVQAIPGEGEIHITTRKEGNYVKVYIKDNGVGIKAEIREKIFEPFFTTKEIGKGTGLGLSISYGIIEDHKGKIEVRSQEEKGSEFIITLPINQL